MYTRINLLSLLITPIMLALLITPVQSTAAQDTCTFTPHFDQTPLYAAPLADPAQQFGTVPGGVALPALKLSGLTYDALFYVSLDATSGGWVDRRSGDLTGDCDALPLDTTPLTAYPTICTATVTVNTPLFLDAQSNEPHPMGLGPGTSYVVTRYSTERLHIRFDHAMGAWAPVSAVTLGPACDTVLHETPFQAIALDNARLWSQPNVQTGDPLITLAAGSAVVILAGPVEGPIRFDTADVGDWYQVTQNGQTGWVWSARLDFTTAPPLPTPVEGPTALDNARLWSQPNVQTGQVIGFLNAGTPLLILSGPVIGPIRYDMPDVGEWYYVQAEGSFYAGWLWAGRIAFD